jgi:hypothetical protein
MDPRTK